jgi:hypothetical protein
MIETAEMSGLREEQTAEMSGLREEQTTAMGVQWTALCRISR